MSEPTHQTIPPKPSTNGDGPGDWPPLKDLPPVEAPSAGFIVQLFVIPAVVVFVVILVWLLFGKLAGGERDAADYVRLIRQSESNSRAAFRAAYELNSLLLNDAKLASDGKLLGELTDCLEHELDRVEDPETAKMAAYLALALGQFRTLEAVSPSGQAIDPISALDRALGAKYPTMLRIAAAKSLAGHAARLEGKLDDPRAVKALARAATEGEVEARQVAVYALGFFGGEGAVDALRARLDDEDRYVRYNAAIALGRRGDERPLAVFREMLNPADLGKVIALATPAESRAKAEAIELEALNALQTSLDEKRPELARRLRPEIEGLTRSGLLGVRNKAQAVLKSLPGPA